MVATILPHGTSIIANTPPNDHDPTHTRIPPPVLNVHTDWCHRLVTPVFEGARDDGASLFHPQCCCCRRHFAQGPLCNLVKYFPTNTEQPHGLVPSSQHHCFWGCQRQWHQPFPPMMLLSSLIPRPMVPTPYSQKSPCPSLTARPTGAVFSVPPFSRVLEMMVPLACTLDVAIVPDAAPNDPDPIQTKSPTLI